MAPIPLPPVFTKAAGSRHLRASIAAGVASRDFFGIAYGQEDERFQGFHVAQNTTPILDESLLLVEPKTAAAFSAKLAEEKAFRDAEAKSKAGENGGATGDDGPT